MTKDQNSFENRQANEKTKYLEDQLTKKKEENQEAESELKNKINEIQNELNS